MVKTIQITTEAWAELFKKKSEIVGATGRSPTYSSIIMEALQNAN